MSIPHKCPVCAGRGTVAHFFYGGGLQSWIGEPPQIECRSCHGSDVVWSPDDEPPAPQPAPLVIPPGTPTGPLRPGPLLGGSILVHDDGHTLTMTSGVGSFTALQGMIPATDRRSSVDPQYRLPH